MSGILDPAADALVQELAAIPEVDAVLLGGSRANGNNDPSSDYDIYVYSETQIPIEARRPVIEKHFAPGYELNNQFWETEDNGVLQGSGIPVDLVYRSLSWLSDHLDNLLDRLAASVWYTTCLWRNLLDSLVIFDREGTAALLKERALVPYPEGLVTSIISKNRPLLRGSFSAFRDQVAKASSRGDLVSVNHRTAQWIASYFDILYALNRIPHPGEKRMVEILEREAGGAPSDMSRPGSRPVRQLPAGWRDDVARLVTAAGADPTGVAPIMDQMVERLDHIL